MPDPTSRSLATNASAVLLALLLLIFLPPAGGQEPSGVEAALAALRDEVSSTLPDQATDGLSAFRWREAKKARINELGWRILSDYPGDPRRWEAAIVLLGQSPSVVASVDEEGLRKLDHKTIDRRLFTYDAEATQRAQARLDELAAQCEAATDMLPETKRSLRLTSWWASFRRHAQSPDAVARILLPALERFVAEYPADPVLPQIVNAYVGLVRERDPAAHRAFLEGHADSPSEQVAALARQGLADLDALARPLDWKFTSVDGREVDLATLRGKVVLVDFWATWCAPCVAKLPELQDLYARYRDHGLEIVGVALETDRARPSDSEEERRAKNDHARQVLLDFVASRGIPWPHFFNGRGSDNPYAKQFGIQSIPHVVLLDRSGKVADRNVKPDRLEGEVQRLLGL